MDTRTCDPASPQAAEVAAAAAATVAEDVVAFAVRAYATAAFAVIPAFLSTPVSKVPGTATADAPMFPPFTTHLA